MGNITLALPNDLHEKMRKHSEIRWSEVVRKSIQEKISLLEMMDELAKKNKMTSQDAKEIADKIKAELSEDFVS
jgi:hypothetical protein